MLKTSSCCKGVGGHVCHEPGGLECSGCDFCAVTEGKTKAVVPCGYACLSLCAVVRAVVDAAIEKRVKGASGAMTMKTMMMIRQLGPGHFNLFFIQVRIHVECLPRCPIASVGSLDIVLVVHSRRRCTDVVQGASIALTIAKMVVGEYLRPAHVAKHAATPRTPHLVAAIFLDDGHHARASADHSRRHGLLDNLPRGVVLVLFDFLASPRYVGFSVAQTTTDLSARRVLAGELPVLVNGRRDGLEVAEGAVFQTLDARDVDLPLLLGIRESIGQDRSQDPLELSFGKARVAVRRVHAFQFEPHNSNFRFRIRAHTDRTEKMGFSACARYHQVHGTIRIATLTFHSLLVIEVSVFFMI